MALNGNFTLNSYYRNVNDMVSSHNSKLPSSPLQHQFMAAIVSHTICSFYTSHLLFSDAILLQRTPLWPAHADMITYKHMVCTAFSETAKLNPQLHRIFLAYAGHSAKFLQPTQALQAARNSFSSLLLPQQMQICLAMQSNKGKHACVHWQYSISVLTYQSALLMIRTVSYGAAWQLNHWCR
jgi:hypothetical protein